MPHTKKVAPIDQESLEEVARKAELNLIFVKLGGTEGLIKLSKLLYRLNSEDRRISVYFEANFMDRFERMFLKFMVGILGGEPYNRRSMVKAHRRLGALTDEHFDAFKENLKLTLSQHGLAPTDIEFLLTQIEPTRDDVIGKSRGDTCPHLKNEYADVPANPTGCTCSIQ